MKPFEKQATAGRALSIIVVETGAPWPIPDLGDEELDVDRVVFAQQAGESPLGFSRRVEDRVRALFGHGGVIRLGAIATSDDDSPVSVETRNRIARALIAASTHQPAAGLVLIGRANRRPRHDLFALAGALCKGLREAHFVRVKMVKSSSSAAPARLSA